MKKLAILFLLVLLAGGGYAAYRYMGRGARYENDLSTVSSRIDDLTTECRSARQWFSSHDEKTDALSDEVEDLEGRVDEKTPGPVRERLGKVSQELSDIKEELAKMKEQFKQEIDSRREAASTKVADLKGSMGSVREGVRNRKAQAKEGVKDTVAELKQIKADTARLMGEMASLKEGMKPVGSKVEEVAHKFWNLRNKFSKDPEKEDTSD